MFCKNLRRFLTLIGSEYEIKIKSNRLLKYTITTNKVQQKRMT